MIYKFIPFCIAVFLLWTISVQAQDEQGVSGFVQLSASSFQFRTNTVAGFLTSGISAKDTPSLYDEPDKQSVNPLLPAFELKYTFRSQKAQLYLGSSMLDIVRLDLVQQFAVRRFLNNKGYVSIGLLGTSIPVTVWEDPYVLNEERAETKRKSFGFRFEWSKIGDSDFGFQYDFRKVAIYERSGDFLGISESDKSKLDRNGNWHRLMVIYRAQIAKEHSLLPTLILKYSNTKGISKKGLGIAADLSYVFRKEKLVLVTNLLIGYRKYEGVNLIYDKKQENTEYSVIQNVFYELIRKRKGSLYLTASGSYVFSNSNIDFHSQSGFLFQVGVNFRFGPIITPKTKPAEAD